MAADDYPDDPARIDAGVKDQRLMGGTSEGGLAWRPGHTMSRNRKTVGGADEQVVSGNGTTVVGRGPENRMVSHAPLKPETDVTNFVDTHLQYLESIDWPAVVVSFPVPTTTTAPPTTTTPPPTTTTTPHPTTTTTPSPTTTTTSSTTTTTTTTTPPPTTTTTPAP